MTPEHRTAWMTRVRMPTPVQWIMFLQVMRYDWQVMRTWPRGEAGVRTYTSASQSKRLAGRNA